MRLDEQLAVDMIVTGNAYVVDCGNGPERADPKTVTHWPNGQVRLDGDEVLVAHRTMPAPDTPKMGRSPLEDLRGE